MEEVKGLLENILSEYSNNNHLKSILEAKKEYFRNKTKSQTSAVKADILKEQHPSMPLTQKRNSSVSVGKKKDSD